MALLALGVLFRLSAMSGSLIARGILGHEREADEGRFGSTPRAERAYSLGFGPRGDAYLLLTTVGASFWPGSASN